jgi:LEA14-like dessication related protein
MKTASRLFSIILILSGLLTTGCASLIQQTEPPLVSVINLKLLDVQLFEQQYGLTMRVQNPNDFPLPIKGLSYNLEVNGSDLAHGVSNKAITIPAFGEKKLELTMVSGTFGIIRQLQSLEQAKQQTLEYRLSGKLSLSSRFLPLYFEKTGALDFKPESLRKK